MSAVIEWLEAMYRAAGPDADKAREALELLAEAQGSEDLLELYGERVGDIDEAAQRLNTLEQLEEWAKRDRAFADFGDLDEETLDRFTTAYERYEQQAWELQIVAADAGLIRRDDHDTNPVPLIAMFVPPAA